MISSSAGATKTIDVKIRSRRESENGIFPCSVRDVQSAVSRGFIEAALQT